MFLYSKLINDDAASASRIDVVIIVIQRTTKNTWEQLADRADKLTNYVLDYYGLTYLVYTEELELKHIYDKNA